MADNQEGIFSTGKETVEKTYPSIFCFILNNAEQKVKSSVLQSTQNKDIGKKEDNQSF